MATQILSGAYSRALWGVLFGPAASTASLFGAFPRELLWHIFDYLPHQDLARLSRTSMSCHALALPYLYRAVDLRDGRVTLALRKAYYRKHVRELTVPADDHGNWESLLQGFMRGGRVWKLVLVCTGKWGFQRALEWMMRDHWRWVAEPGRRCTGEVIELDIEINFEFSQRWREKLHEMLFWLNQLPERPWRVTFRSRLLDETVAYFLAKAPHIFTGLAKMRFHVSLPIGSEVPWGPGRWAQLAPVLSEIRLTGSALEQLAGMEGFPLRKMRLETLGLRGPVSANHAPLPGEPMFSLDHVRLLEEMPTPPGKLMLDHLDVDFLVLLAKGFVRYPSVEIVRGRFRAPAVDRDTADRLAEALSCGQGIAHLRVVLLPWDVNLDPRADGEYRMWEALCGPPLEDSSTASFVWPRRAAGRVHQRHTMQQSPAITQCVPENVAIPPYNATSWIWILFLALTFAYWLLRR
ncbi:hypothetical protein DFJ74DRAFT_668101 [Hyaloraphidium curvatum]|nr:hypothetical protein DFJ74DRAFT_668101 [Hyaloraphidium curvatum]